MSNYMQSGTDQTIARKHNRAQILNRLRLQRAVSRANLANQTGLTRSTISRIVDQLIEEKLIHEIASSKKERGRPSVLLSLNPKGGSAIGLEIGVHFISILLTDFLSNPIWRKRIAISGDCDWETYSAKAEDLIRSAIEIANENQLPLMGIGAAVWGLVNNHNQMVYYAPNLKWRNIPLGSKWNELFHVPIIIENESNASALGEYYFGAGKDIENFIYLSMDIGVGSGIISKGRLFRGAFGYAGEFGHILIDCDGELCSCGRRGCLETKVGRHVITQQYKDQANVDNITLEEIIQRGLNGDSIAKQIFDQAGEYLGLGMGTFVNLVNPQGIILGWSLGQAYNLLLPGIQKGLERSSLPDLRKNLFIMPSLNGSDDALLGSIALVLDDIIRETL